MSSTRPRCAVVTCFNEGQPGFLDFRYRLQALASRYDVSIISNVSLDIPEFRDIEMSRYFFSSGAGTLGWLRYLWHCCRWIGQVRPAVLILLNSSAAPILVMGNFGASVLYWNEHPTHVAPNPGGGHPIRSIWRSFIRSLMFQGARRASVVMPIGEAHRDDLFAHGCLADRIHMIYMGVADQFASVKALRMPSPVGQVNSRPLELIYVGSVSKERGRDVMIEALGLVNRGAINPRVKLTIIGARPEEIDTCKSLARSHGVESALNVLGRIPGGEVPLRLVEADMGICLWEDKPWYQFNPPTKLFEYLAAGLPVIASNIRTHTEYIATWENGVIFEYGPVGLAAAINKVLTRKGDLRALSEGAFISGQKYLWSRIEPHFMAAVSSLVELKGGQS